MARVPRRAISGKRFLLVPRGRCPTPDLGACALPLIIRLGAGSAARRVEARLGGFGWIEIELAAHAGSSSGFAFATPFGASFGRDAHRRADPHQVGTPALPLHYIVLRSANLLGVAELIDCQPA